MLPDGQRVGTIDPGDIWCEAHIVGDIVTEAIQKAVLWRSLGGVGLEQCELAETFGGWRLSGIVVTTRNESPVTVAYAVETDAGWRTVGATIAVEDFGTTTIQVRRDAVGRWWCNDSARRSSPSTPVELVALAGCIDIDLGFTPATNTLPIRRLDLAVGAAVAVNAAWLRWPELEFEALSQRYHRLDAHRYHYESGNGAFHADLDVDDLGLVAHYSGGWDRVADATP